MSTVDYVVIVSASHPAHLIARSLARLSMVVYIHRAAWSRGVIGADLRVLHIDIAEALKISRALGACDKAIKCAISAGVSEASAAISGL